MVDLAQVRRQVDKAARGAAVGVLKAVPSPGDPYAEQGDDCGCGRRKRKMIDSIKKGKSAAQIVKEAMADIKGN